MKSLIALCLVAAVCLPAQDAQAPNLVPRSAITERLRQESAAQLWWADFYDGAATVGGPYQRGVADGLEMAARMVENYADREEKVDAVEERHEDELVVLNILRAAYGLPPYETYPE